MKAQIVSFAQRFKGNDLRAQCARSGAVLTVGTVAAKGLAFLSKMILVRLLVPEEMGLMVLVLSLTALFETLTEVGIKQSVIQNKDGAKSEYLNTAWWFQSVRALGLYVVAFAVAPSLCRFYFADKPEVLAHHAWPELYLLVRVAFLSILFNGLVSPRAHVLEKEFRFGKAVFLMQGSAILGAGITIVLAFALRNVWAMVIGFASMTLLRCLLSFILCPFLPRLSFDRDSFRSLYKFARGIFGSPILTYIAFNADVLVAGKIVTPQLLGMYGMALALAGIPRELFARIIGPVLLPAFAKKQDDHKTLCATVLRLTGLAALFMSPFAAVAVVCGKTILGIVFTEGIYYLLANTGFIDFMLKIISYGTTTNVQYWEFKAGTRYGKAVFRMFAADENGEEKEYFREEYQQTCFDLTYFMIERDGNTICLQSEN